MMWDLSLAEPVVVVSSKLPGGQLGFLAGLSAIAFLPIA